MDDKFVDEFPRPPVYFHLFKDDALSQLASPAVPESTKQIEEHIFGKIFTEPPVEPFVDPFAHVAQLKETLKTMLHDILPLITLSTDQEQKIYDQDRKLRDTVEQFFALLASYREHEARAALTDQLRRDLEAAKAVEQDLLRCISSAKSVLDS